MCVRCRRDEQIHRSSSRLAPGIHHCGGDLAVAGRHSFIERQGIKAPLQQEKSPQPFSADLAFLGHKDTEVQFGQRHRADRQFPLNGSYIRRYHHAGVQDRSHRLIHGSRTPWSISSRSASQAGSAGPPKSSATSDHRRHARGVAGTNRAPGRPATVIVISSPSSTRRMRSEAFCRSSRKPTVSTRQQ